MSCPIGTRTSTCCRNMNRACGKIGCFISGMLCPVLAFVIYTAVTTTVRSSAGELGAMKSVMKMPSKMAQNGSTPLRALPVIRLPIAEGINSVRPSKSLAASFNEAVLRYMCPYTSSIVLSSGGFGYADMAVNLYKTSYERFRMRNHLFVGSDEKFCRVLRRHGAHCVRYLGVQGSEESSPFRSKDFLRKTYLKVKIVKDAISLNVTVLLVDLDVVFLKNPLLYLGCDGCDIMMQDDGFEDKLNTGFYLIKPTKSSQLLLERAWSMILSGNYSKVSDQMIINHVLVDMKKRDEIRQVTLDINVYPDGVVFFKDGGRVFKGDNPCRTCIIVHNNGLVTKEAKRYRFKEYGLWLVDDDGYYSDRQRKYIVYDNPTLFESDSEMKSQELRALRTAFIIGYILNRTVILPKFHKDNKLTSLLPLVSMSKLDALLADSYREHVFLRSPLVPRRTRNSVTPPFLLQPLMNSTAAGRDVDDGVIIKHFAAPALPVQRLITWFSLTPAQVLRFHSLYIDIQSAKLTRQFLKVVDKALR